MAKTIRIHDDTYDYIAGKSARYKESIDDILRRLLNLKPRKP